MSDRRPSTTRDDPARILLVDDNATNLQVLSKLLSGRGYELLIAMDGDSALKIAAKALPTLILLDIMMPGLDGFEVCRRLKADPATRDAAVIFLSALGETKSKISGLDLGAVDYITKPFQSDEVIARVNAHVTLQRLQKALAERIQELAVLNERMKTDLQAAADIQRSLLPTQLPESAGARLAWTYRPCEELGGDSLNVFELDPRHIGAYVLDVTGHGVRAALLSVSLTHALTPRIDRTSIVTREDGVRSIVPPSEVVGQLNRMFPMNTATGQFATVLYGVLDTEEGLFHFASAGHPAPIIVRGSEVLICSEIGNLPIGIRHDVAYNEKTIRLGTNDRLFLYSDGLIEARNAAGDLFGTERLLGVVTSNRSVTLDETVHALEKHVMSWAGTEHLEDDLSIMAVEMR